MIRSQRQPAQHYSGLRRGLVGGKSLGDAAGYFARNSEFGEGAFTGVVICDNVAFAIDRSEKVLSQVCSLRSGGRYL